MHLIGNIVYLWIFGDIDERRDKPASLLLVVGQNSTAPRHSGTMIRRFDP